MTTHDKDHAHAVDAWMKDATAELSSELLVQLFDQTLAALWKKARLSVSAVMLTAVADRVIFNGAEAYPFLNTLQVGEEGIGFEELRPSARGLDRSEILAAFRMTVTELLAILGNLTNQVITPELHSELSKIKFEPKLKVLPRVNGDIT